MTKREHELTLVPDAVPARHRRVLQDLGVCGGVPEGVPSTLLHRAKDVVTVSRAAGVPTPPVGYAPLFRGWRIVRGGKRDWLLCPVEEDPVVRRYGGRLPAPPPVIARVHRLVVAGVDFDCLYIGHEMPRGTEFDLIADTVQPPVHPRVHTRVSTLGRVVQRLWQGVAAVGRTTWGLPVGAMISARRVGTQGSPAAATSTAALDPVLLGVLTAGTMGVWFYIAHWWWEGGDAAQ